jgi:hypothetical protein
MMRKLPLLPFSLTDDCESCWSCVSGQAVTIQEYIMFPVDPQDGFVDDHKLYIAWSARYSFGEYVYVIFHS